MPPPVPVLLMSHSLHHGGGERQLALTALSLDRTRFTPHIACSEGGFWVSRLEEAGVPFFFIQSRSLISRAAVGEVRRLQAYIREHGIRIVQTFDFSMNVFGIAAARPLSGVVSLSNLRCHMSLIPPRYRWLNHLAHRVSNAVVVNSDALKNHLITDCRIPAARILTCYNGIDTEVFHPATGSVEGLPEVAGASLVVGSICVLRPEKNLKLLLNAFAKAAAGRPDARLLIVGSGPEATNLQNEANHLGIAGQCSFQPSTSDVRKYLWNMDIFVLPSLNEGLSNALMEAMACGCCVLASKVGGNPELVTEGETGLLFPSEDEAALTAQLVLAMDNADRRRRLAAAATERMKTGFSLQASTGRMQQIYDSVQR